MPHNIPYLEIRVANHLNTLVFEVMGRGGEPPYHRNLGVSGRGDCFSQNLPRLLVERAGGEYTLDIAL